jgi:hypothetical protein
MRFKCILSLSLVAMAMEVNQPLHHKERFPFVRMLNTAEGWPQNQAYLA